MPISAPTIVVTCDFPSCTESVDSFTHDLSKIDWNVIINGGFGKIDNGYKTEYFCRTHKNWFISRTFIDVKMSDL